jgi:hypothetical protein
MDSQGHREGGPAGAGDVGARVPVDVRAVDELLAFLVRRTKNPQLAADLTAETLAAAVAMDRSDAAGGPAGARLQRLALERLADAQRRGAVDRAARRRLGMERIELTAADAAAIEALGRGRAARLWVGWDAPPASTAFATRLSRQLADGEKREEQRATVAAPSRRGRRLVAAALVAVVLAVGATVVSSVTDTGTAPAAPGPRVIANVTIADGLGRTANVAFGSVWLSATNDEAVLRVDPRTRRVLARIRVGTDVNIGAGAGAVWAVPRRPTIAQARLIRIDPRTNRVVARIPILTPGSRYPLGGAAIVAGPLVWVVGAQGLLGVDQRTNRPVRRVVLGGDYLVAGAVLHGNELWVSRADGSVTRFDAVTGRRLGRLGFAAPSGLVLPRGERAVTLARDSVALVDRASGRTLWRTRLGTQLNDVDVVAGRPLVEGTDRATSPDSLWELDPQTGKVTGSVTVPGFSVTVLLRVGREAWLATADGHVIVVAP